MLDRASPSLDRARGASLDTKEVTTHHRKQWRSTMDNPFSSFSYLFFFFLSFLSSLSHNEQPLFSFFLSFLLSLSLSGVKPSQYVCTMWRSRVQVWTSAAFLEHFNICSTHVQKATRFNNTAQQPIQSPQRFQLGL